MASMRTCTTCNQKYETGFIGLRATFLVGCCDFFLGFCQNSNNTLAKKPRFCYADYSKTGWNSEGLGCTICITV
jgi:hypothetical protein